jgi:hypothetical protein
MISNWWEGVSNVKNLIELFEKAIIIALIAFSLLRPELMAPILKALKVTSIGSIQLSAEETLERDYVTKDILRDVKKTEQNIMSLLKKIESEDRVSIARALPEGSKERQSFDFLIQNLSELDKTRDRTSSVVNSLEEIISNTSSSTKLAKEEIQKTTPALSNLENNKHQFWVVFDAYSTKYEAKEALRKAKNDGIHNSRIYYCLGAYQCVATVDSREEVDKIIMNASNRGLFANEIDLNTWLKVGNGKEIL